MNTCTKCIVSMVILGFVASGQTLPPSVVFSPLGPWPMCSSYQSAPHANDLLNVQYCSGVAKGSEPDLLSIKALDSSTTDFLYIITGVDTNGVTRTLSGHFKREDNVAGFSSTIVHAGMITALVTTVEYSYNPDAGRFLSASSTTNSR